MAKERRGEPESTSPGPHGMFKTTTGVHKKYKERVGEEARKSTSPGPHGMKESISAKKGKVPGFAKEMAASGKGQFHAEKISIPMTKKQRAAELTRKMKKGYRKGYRVPKRPGRSSGR